jgi:polyisoprenoid-binding protein YceI
MQFDIIIMKNIFLIFVLTGLTLFTGYSQEKFTADTSKTTLTWLGEKVTGQHTGTIKLQSGWLTWSDNKIVAGEFIIDMNSIKESAGEKRLEAHLKTDDFFSVEKFPVARLVLTGSNSFEKGSALVRGNLTIKGITNPIEFKSNIQRKDYGLWFFSDIAIDRTKYNVRYGSGTFFDNLGDKVIYDEFKVKVAMLVRK